MFYRRKIVLSLIKAFGGEIEKTRLQKLIFLVCQRQRKADYDFVPYKYGCYSFSLKADLVTMVNKGLISETTTSYKLESKTEYLSTLKADDKKWIREVNNFYHSLPVRSLIKYTYKHYPYWASKSLIAEEILDKEDFAKVQTSYLKTEETIMYTIGYEGSSVEEYFNKLIKSNVNALIDVRSNPLSMKYGFSKNQLKGFCEKLGIEYHHFPEVGIKSEYRQELNTQQDYDNLFKLYRADLPTSLSTQNAILDLLKQRKRIALTCFEADICQCHRKPLAEAIAMLPEFKYSLKHI